MPLLFLAGNRSRLRSLRSLHRELQAERRGADSPLQVRPCPLSETEWGSCGACVSLSGQARVSAFQSSYDVCVSPSGWGSHCLSGAPLPTALAAGRGAAAHYPWGVAAGGSCATSAHADCRAFSAYEKYGENLWAHHSLRPLWSGMFSSGSLVRFKTSPLFLFLLNQVHH